MSQKFKKSTPNNISKPNNDNQALQNISGGMGIRRINKLLQEIKSRVGRLPSPIRPEDQREIEAIDEIISQIPEDLKSEIDEQIKIINTAKAQIEESLKKDKDQDKNKKPEPKKEGKTYRFQFYMTPSMHEKLEEIAYHRRKEATSGRITVGSIINEALEAYVSNQQKSE